MSGGYDRALTVFSPDGHLFQVEYALEAVNRGTTAVGIKGKEIVVLGAEKLTVGTLQDSRTLRKITNLDHHLGITFAGLQADARILINKARTECQAHKLSIEDPMTVSNAAAYIAGIQQKYTNSGGRRPFGISTLICGFQDGPKLYQTDPSGIYYSWKATAIGRSSKSVREYLEKFWAEGMSDHEVKKLVVKALLEVVQSGHKNIIVSYIKSGSQMVELTEDEVKAFADEIQKEKDEEAEKKAKKNAQ